MQIMMLFLHAKTEPFALFKYIGAMFTLLQTYIPQGSELLYETGVEGPATTVERMPHDPKLGKFSTFKYNSTN